MNPKYQRAADRLRELITEGERVASLERDSAVGPYIKEKVPLHAWLAKVENIVGAVFGKESAHFRQVSGMLDLHPEQSYEVNQIVVVLTGGLSDLEGGFLAGQEHLIAGAIFDSVLEEAKHLTEAGFKDPAAVLVRVVVEDCLKRLSREEGLDDSAKASAMNDALRDKSRYPKPQWRLVQAWLDIGNSAAHGKFTDYSKDDVLRMVGDVGRFLAQHLSP